MELLCHTEITNFADAHVVNENVFEFDVTMDVVGCVVEVSETANDLSEHHTCVVVEEGWGSVSFEDIEERTGWTVESEEIICIIGADGGEEREDVFVRERGPDSGLSLQTGVSTRLKVGSTNDFYGSNRVSG